MITTLADPWLTQNAGRKYPLADDTDTTIPDDAILEFRCTVRGFKLHGTPTARIYYIGSRNDPNLGSVKYADVEILDGPAGGRIGTIRFDVPRSAVARSYHTAVAANGGIYGALTVQYAFTLIPYGAFDAVFSPTTVIADDLKVDSVQSAVSVESTDPTITHNPTTRLTGRLVLAEGFNTEPYLDGNRLRLNVAKRSGIGEWCQTAGAGQTCRNVLFTINGERPGSDGNLRLTGENGIRVTPLPDEHALRIELDDVAREKMLTTCEKAC